MFQMAQAFLSTFKAEAQWFNPLKSLCENRLHDRVKKNWDPVYMGF